MDISVNTSRIPIVDCLAPKEGQMNIYRVEDVPPKILARLKELKILPIPAKITNHAGETLDIGVYMHDTKGLWHGTKI